MMSSKLSCFAKTSRLARISPLLSPHRGKGIPRRTNTLESTRRFFQIQCQKDLSTVKNDSIRPMATALFITHNGGGKENSNLNNFVWKLGSVGLFMASSCLYGADNTTALEESAEQKETMETTTTETDENANDVEENADEDDKTTEILNWSGTHSIDVANEDYWEPETLQELEDIVQKCHAKGQPLRPLGSALSPNGIGFQPAGMVSLVNLDKIVKIDKQNMTVTVQAGARVSHVVDALREHGLTLPNLASIAEQQMGGLTQVGAHGTGAAIPPIDEFVTRIKLVTPGRGTIELTEEDGELFKLTRVAMGCLGVVAEVTMKVIPAHNLVEHTFVLTRSEAKEQLNTLLKEHKHMRYMWIPYEDAVVVVTNDPEESVPLHIPRQSSLDESRFDPMIDLLLKLTPDKSVTRESLKGSGFGELRDALLAIDSLNPDHIKRVNKAEAEFWRRSEGYQTKPSDQLLQFDCGGQQWVKEVVFPCGSASESNMADMEFMERLNQGIEEQGIAAPAPLEQRWTSSSSSLMSPANGAPDGLHSWVGVIMYLPSDVESERQNITKAFKGQYCDLLQKVGGGELNAVSHWAKQEIPGTVWDILELQESMEIKYPLDKFNAARSFLDPKNILGNSLINLIMGRRPWVEPKE
eukprot:CAMPEP_0195298530 /NCGR_PEP_ID=MMETSP0707-20130614/23665_1 /TAXON_ID=33640 /ORGANISM="Asterionellopsis glacialis, Strain CCMP134" /LENGTH=638 /DNA_ID=CAMNT_0040360675 /DNA_START=38 /DNA_END=1954 /DNA_ORIENTATION=+